jgi:hypothetical protein
MVIDPGPYIVNSKVDAASICIKDGKAASEGTEDVLTESQPIRITQKRTRYLANPIIIFMKASWQEISFHSRAKH